ncbi:uncharacterized protein LOC127856170 isoform X1 [Dreissena polymorpha]|uniref:uncharacterized protein LOC127856170 isoform X1 n=1 Tax=Dreissena polymorpha TaxID=45954 RepID=UPI002264A09B|nr:uncharacterized protein LOC127856170 isoform X1 [Dreissena polymorpha]
MADAIKEITTFKCGPCLFDGDTVEPKHFCVNCLEYLCSACAREHRRHKSSREHTILEDNEFPQDVTLFEEMKKLPYCPKHPNVEIDQHCPSHDVLFCSQCLQKDHGLCERVTNLACSLEEISATKNQMELLNDLLTKSKAKQTEFFKHLEEARIHVNAVELEINSFIQTLKHVVQNIERTLNERFTKVTQPFKHYDETLSNIVKKASFYEHMQAITSRYGTAKQNVALNFTLSVLLKELESNDSIDSVFSKQIQFLKSNNFEDLISELNRYDVVLRSKDERASDICSDEEDTYEDALDHLQTNKRDEATQVEQLMIAHELGPKRPLRNLAVKHDDIRLLKIESQKPETIMCSIVALHVLSDGRILLLQQENILKLHSRTLTLISKFQFKQNVKDMCISDQNKNGLFTVAVCFEQSRTITFIEHDVTFQERHTIHCSDNVFSISMYVHHLVALVETKGLKSSYEIQLLDKSTGHACYAFDEFKRMNDTHSLHGTNVVIVKPTRIYACKTKMKITLADANTVYIFKIEDGDCNHQTVCAVGQCVWKLSDIEPNLNNVRDVKCDSQGHVYALTKSYLYQIPQPCINYNLRCLISDCRTAAAVAIDEYSQSIVLGQKNADRAHVYSYRFSTDK